MRSLMLITITQSPKYHRSAFESEKQTLKKYYQDAVCLWGKKTFIRKE